MSRICSFFLILIFLAICRPENLKFKINPRDLLYGHCYDIKSPKDFQPDRFFSKRWYEIKRYRNDFENEAECVYIAADTDENGSWSLIFYLQFPDSSVDAVFGTVRPVNESKFEAQFTDDSAWSSLSILDTDYENYGIIYSCWQKPNEPIATKQERLWILSTTPEITPDTEEKITKSLKISENVDLSIYLDEVNQKTCSRN